MNTTGFNPGAYEAMVSEATALRNRMEESGNAAVQKVAALTGEGLSGASAGASEEMAQGVQAATARADEAIQVLNRIGQEFGQNLGQNDAAGAAGLRG